MIHHGWKSYADLLELRRSLIPVDWGWASEVIPYFEKDDQEGAMLNVYIWPANTKTQGRQVFYRAGKKTWENKTTITVEGHGSFPSMQALSSGQKGLGNLQTLTCR